MGDACEGAGLVGYETADSEIEETYFKSRRTAANYLREVGYHRTARYAKYPRLSYRANYTRDLGDGNRYEAWIEQEGDGFVIRSEGPEPNPEINIAGIRRGEWPLRVAKWHLEC